MNRLLIILPTIFISLLFGCHKDKAKDDIPNAWVKLGNKLNYDLITDTSNISNFRQLEVIRNPGNPNLRFRENNIYEPSSTYWQNLMDENYNVYRMEDGLYTTACSTCSFDCFSSFKYMRVPLKVFPSQLIPLYHCKDNVSTNLKIIVVDTTITVPLGTFKVFVGQDTSSLKKEFWNADKGLIRLECYDKASQKLLRSFVISSTNY